LIAALSAALAAALVVPDGVASSALTPADGGVVRLHLGASDYFRFDAPNGAGGYTAGAAAPITVSNCLATTTGVMTLAAIPATGKVGLVSDSIGVKGKGEGTGQPCGRADGPDQGLVVKLASSLAGKKIDYAELDLEGKFDVVVRADLYLNGTKVGTATQGFGTHSDSGPDSADGDNQRFYVSAGTGAVFDELRMTVDPSTPSGAFSLEGGADGTAALAGGLGSQLGTSDSLFHLVDGVGILGCNDPSVTTGGNGTPQVKLTRLSNQLGTDADCTRIPYSLTVSRGQVDLSKDLGSQAQYIPQFNVQIIWEPEAATYPVARTTQIDYHDGQGFHVVKWCNGTPSAPTLPAGELWCLVTQDNATAGNGLIQVTELYYGAGDPTWK
jgi:hypothetical protein